MARHPVCISCGQPTGPGPHLNRLTDGRPCPSCVERLLDTLPPLLPARLEELTFEEWGDDDDSTEDYLPGA